MPKEIPPEQIGLISESTKSAEGEVAFRGLRNEAVRTEIAPLQRSPAAPATAALDPKLIYLMLESHPEARYFLDEKPIQVDKNHPHTVTPGDHAVTFYFRGGHILEARFQANPGQHLLCTADWEAQTAHCGPWSH